VVVCRYEYLSNAVLQARSGSRAPGGLGLSPELSDSGLMELLEGKLAVLRFQLKIKEALDRLGSGGSADEGGNAPMEEDGFLLSRAFSGAFVDESRVHAAREKSEELSTELKSITQLYNDYACRFELWEVSQMCSCWRPLEPRSTGRVGAGSGESEVLR
jgi:nuclear pore complex protein Nup155